MQYTATRNVRLVIAIALSMTMGGHWFLLQTVAWTGMLITYSRDANIVEAVSKTFDGAHPCPLCKTIKQGRDDERKKSPSVSLTKMDLKYLKPQGSPLAAPAFRPHSWPLLEQMALAIAHEPPVPPPRVGA
jgi:hypothetical protein